MSDQFDKFEEINPEFYLEEREEEQEQDWDDEDVDTDFAAVLRTQLAKAK